MESIWKIESKYLPNWKISIHEVMNMPTIIGELSINQEMTDVILSHLNDRRHVCDFIYADFSIGKVLWLYFSSTPKSRYGATTPIET